MIRWLLLLSLVSSTALAAPPAATKDVEALHQEAARAFEAGRYDAAAEAFLAAYAKKADPAFLFNIGLCYERRRQWRLALDYYDRFLAVSATAPAAADVRRRREVVAATRESERGTVRVSAEARGVRVEVRAIDGVRRCVTPCEVRVDPGPVSVAGDLGGRRVDAAGTVAAAATWTAALDVGTNRPHGGLRVVVDVPNAQVAVDGTTVAAGTTTSWPAGAHRVRVSAPGKTPFDVEVEVPMTGIRDVDVRLMSSTSAERRRVAGYALVGVSAAATVTAVVLGSLALTQFRDARDFASANASSAATEADLADRRSAIRGLSIGADVAMGLAIGAGVTGLVLCLVGQGPQTSSRVIEDAP